MANRSGILSVYRGLGYVAEPALRLLVAWRARRNKEDPARRRERYGYPSVNRPDGSLIWVHAASVGETNAVLPLIDRLCAQGHAILLTTTTVTSARIASNRLPQGAIHQYVPFDVVPAIRRFLDAWRPALAIFVESEIWPATLSELKQRGIARAIVNGRLSSRSWRRWRKRRRLASAVFGLVDICLAQTEEDARRYHDLGVQSAFATGNLKYDGSPPPGDTSALAELKTAIGTRPVWIAASTHAGEEEYVADAHGYLMAEYPDLLTLIAPRHPHRGDEITDLIRARGLKTTQRSADESLSSDTVIYVADTIGEMGVFYRLAPIAFLGGSLVPFGGHNPIEPAQLHSALISGPHVQNFADVYRELTAADASIRVENTDALAKAVSGLLGNADHLDAQRARAEAIIVSGQGALNRTLDALRPLTENLQGGNGEE